MKARKIDSRAPFAVRISIAALLVALASARGISAQETDAASRDDFEAALFAGSLDATGVAPPEAAPLASQEPTGISFDAGAASGEKAKTEYLVGGTVAAQAQGTFDSLSRAVSSDAAGKIFGKVSVPDYGALYVAYNVSHVFFRGYSGDGTPPPAAGQTPAYSLSEFHYSFDVAKRLFVRIGNQLISWGPSRVWSPVDFINLSKEDSFAALDTRAGKSGLRLHAPLPFGNAFGFADFSGMVERDRRGAPLAGDPVETVNLGGRLDGTAGGFEFGITGYGGKHADPKLGADLSGRILGSTVYGEFSATGTDAFADPSFMASVGLSRALGELRDWTVSCEAFWNSRPGTDPLYQGEYYAYASVAADKLFSPSLKTTASALANLDDGSYSLKFAESLAFPRAVPFTLSVSYSGGGGEKEFTRYSGDRSVSVTASTTINF